jgi:polar amino acid transport system substrate-binding protein
MPSDVLTHPPTGLTLFEIAKLVRIYESLRGVAAALPRPTQESKSMSRFSQSRSLRRLFTSATVMALVLTGCSANDTTSAGDNTAPLYDQLPSSIQQAGAINVGSSIDYPPFEYYDADGKTLKGFEPELAGLLEGKLGVKFNWNNANFDALFSALRGGRYDIVYGAVNDTPEREKTFDFVTYLQSSQAFVVAKGNPEHIRVLDDICGKAVAAVRGGIQAEFLEAQSSTCQQAGKGKIDVLTFDGNSGEQLAVKQGRAAALLENYPTAVTFAEGSDGALEVVPNLQVAKQFFGMVLDKRNTQLRDALQKAWQAIIDDGSYKKVLEKWKLGDIAVQQASVNAADKSGS